MLDEIAASERARGKNRERSVAAARRKVKDGSLYLIRRHGQWFRPGAHGYTSEVSDAGLFDADEARGYLDVEGLSVVIALPIVGKAQAEATLRLVKIDGLLSRIADAEIRHRSRR